MSTAENKAQSEIAAILQRQIYESNIKHYIEPFAGDHIAADKIICEHRLVVAPNGKTADELQAAMPDVLIGCGGYADLCLPPTSKALIYCDITGDPLQDDAFWLWCRQRAAENHKVFILTTETLTEFAPIWNGRNKNKKLHLYGGTLWQK
ncbi:MAG: hypothetical protein K2M47_00785 [Clostridiales bacterium]|nr:hypothetical protein [Clostridiales bacterium]MDE6200405.1 hypothetical protein [Clostridiales bacterium]